MNNQDENNQTENISAGNKVDQFDYTHVTTVARIAFYDDLKSAPRVTEIQPAPTEAFIEALAATIYEQAKTAGGTIPYTVVREVSENFIHAKFTEIIVSILDSGNTIRFADQGPGINHKDRAQLPGFSSAVEPMKHYIRGVGSGLPIVREYLDFSHGTISIEDNLGTGAVVTISLSGDESKHLEYLTQPSLYNPSQQNNEGFMQEMTRSQLQTQTYRSDQGVSYQQHPADHYEQPRYQQVYETGYQPIYQQGNQPSYQPGYPAGPQLTQGYATPQVGTSQQPYIAPIHQNGSSKGFPMPPLSQREREFLPIFLNEGALGVTDLVRLTGAPQSSTYVALTKLEEAGLIDKTVGQKRILTDFGYQVASSL